jgi:hypothetical protein
MDEQRLGDWVHEEGGWRRDRVTTGPYRLNFHGTYKRGKEPVVSFSFDPEDLPGWRVTMRYRLHDGAIRFVGLSIDPAEPGDVPDEGSIFRRSRKLEAQVHRELREPMIQRLLPPAWRGVVLAKRRSGRRPITDLELAELAEAYVQACEEQPRRPTALLVERRHESYDTLQANLRRAAKRGLLVRNGHGKAGGHLTDRARTILTDKEQTNGER